MALAAAPSLAPAPQHEEQLHPYTRMVLLQRLPPHLLLVRTLDPTNSFFILNIHFYF